MGARRPDLPAVVSVGRVVRPHGVRGELLVELLTDNPERFAPGSELLVAARAAAGEFEQEAAGAPDPFPRLRVAASRPHKGALLVHFEGIDGRDAAEGWRGAELSVERARVPPPEPGTYYHFQLVGCRCRDRRAGELGEVVEVVEDGGGLLLVVDDGRRRLPVPFVRGFLVAVDVEAGTIELDLPEGLIEVCGSAS